MVHSALRIVLCILIGALAGGVLGPLFVPDPAGLLAAILAIGVMVVTSVYLYRSEFLAGKEPAT